LMLEPTEGLILKPLWILYLSSWATWAWRERKDNHSSNEVNFYCCIGTYESLQIVQMQQNHLVNNLYQLCFHTGYLPHTFQELSIIFNIETNKKLGKSMKEMMCTPRD
jgi:hypothetical protein